MKSQEAAQKKKGSRAAAHQVMSGPGALPFRDNRPEALVQRKLGQAANDSSQVKQLKEYQQMANGIASSQCALQMRRVTVTYGGHTVIGHDTENLTLSQLQNLIQHPDLTQQNRTDIQLAILNKEYKGAPQLQPNTGFKFPSPFNPNPQKPPQQSGFRMPPPMTSFASPMNFGSGGGNMMGMSQPRQSPSFSSGGMMNHSMQRPSTNFMAPPNKMMPPPSMNMMPPPSKMQSGGNSGGFKQPVFGMGFKVPFSGGGGGIRTLYRGVNHQGQAIVIKSTMSAGGLSPDPNCGKPGEQQVIGQVGMDDTAPWAKSSTPFKQSDVTEYTSDPTVARSYGSTRGGMITVQIDNKYLKRGDSGPSKGWIALKNAPLHKFVSYEPPSTTTNNFGK